MIIILVVYAACHSTHCLRCVFFFNDTATTDIYTDTLFPYTTLFRSWNHAISPAGLAFYGGDLYPGWKNSLLMGALSGEGLFRMAIDGETLHKSEDLKSTRLNSSH